jgi:hypothetical protein
MIMSNIIETLLLRNLQEVFGEGDPERRRSAIEQLYTEDCVVNLPVGQYHGHDALDKICGGLRASHPSYVYTPHNGRKRYRTADVLTGVLDPQANRRGTRVSTSSLPVTARFQPFTSSSTPRRSEAGSTRKSAVDVSGIGDLVIHVVANALAAVGNDDPAQECVSTPTRATYLSARVVAPARLRHLSRT